MDRDEIIHSEQQYVLQTYARPEMVIERGEGAYLYDSDGKRYLDFMAGIAVTALGHSDPEWAAAVSEQASKLVHVSNLFHTAPHAALAKRLVEHSFADRVYFCNSGTEANEAALKFARKFARRLVGEDVVPPSVSQLDNPTFGHTIGNPKAQIVAFTGGFHGRTMGSLATTHKAKYREPFAPLMPGVVFATFNDLTAAEHVITEDTCAVIVEPIQGEGGVNAATPEFLRKLRELCDHYDALLIFDEVQCGLGRTGTLWAYEQAGIEPDIMTLAKPLANGLPIGATLVRDEIAAAIQPGDHGSTFAAGPVPCRAGQVVFDRVSAPAFLAHVTAMGNYLKSKLSGLASSHIGEIRGHGLLVGVDLDIPAASVMAAARQRGLLVINAGDYVLRLAPPLIVEQTDIDKAMAILGDCLSEL